MNVGVIDAGIVIGWFRGAHRSQSKLQTLFDSCKAGKSRLVISIVNLAEVLFHTSAQARVSGVDVPTLLRSYRVEIHSPTEAIAYRVSKLSASLADAFAAATAQELGARLHTTDRELVASLKTTRLPVSRY